MLDVGDWWRWTKLHILQLERRSSSRGRSSRVKKSKNPCWFEPIWVR